jgi:hypothetical protein
VMQATCRLMFMFSLELIIISGVPRNFVRGEVSTSSVKDRRRDLGGGSPLVRGSAHFANE